MCGAIPPGEIITKRRLAKNYDLFSSLNLKACTVQLSQAFLLLDDRIQSPGKYWDSALSDISMSGRL